MRAVPDPPMRRWEPPSYRVSDTGKVEGADRPDDPTNWGRWGEQDQRGTANLMTPDRIRAAAGLIRTGKRFSLALPIGGIPTPGYRDDPIHLMDYTTADLTLGDAGRAGLQVSDDHIVIALQATTQLDGLGHVGHDDLLYNGYWSGVVTARSGARRLGIHQLADGLVGRAVLVDVARQVGVDHLEKSFAIGPDLLDQTLAAQGVEVIAGDILLVRTGHIGWWFSLPDRDKSAFGGGEPGLSPRTVPWLAERDVAMVATDTLAAEVMPPEEGERPLAFHIRALRDLGLMIGEMLDLEELSADCAGDGVYEGFFVAMPMPVVGAVGSPINPLVIK
jgi:kynurenine formamidase